MQSDLQTDIVSGFDHTFDSGGEWDRLLASSYANTIFLTSGWLRAWAETTGNGANVLVTRIRKDGSLVAAAVFQEQDGVVEFAGKGPSDYSDVLISHQLDESTAKLALETLLSATKAATHQFDHFRLARIPDESKTLSYLSDLAPRFFTTRIGAVAAPTMDMTAADQALRKKSLKRHERGLERRGNLTVETYSSADDIRPVLDSFFEQHIQRWKDTESPSLFLDNENREFYRRVVEYLDQTNTLRFTRVALDGKMVAAHFGFYYADRYTWYKPTFDPGLKKLSPGEVLIKKLIEHAKNDEAREFDFTIGSEKFKYRFATKIRNVVTVHVTDSLTGALTRRTRIRIAKNVRALVGDDIWRRMLKIRSRRKSPGRS